MEKSSLAKNLSFLLHRHKVNASWVHRSETLSHHPIHRFFTLLHTFVLELLEPRPMGTMPRIHHCLQPSRRPSISQSLWGLLSSQYAGKFQSQGSCIPNIKALTGSPFLPNLGSGLADKATKCEDMLGRGQESVSPESRPKVFRWGSMGEGAAHSFLCHRAGDFAGAQRTRTSREDDKVRPQRQGSKTPSSKGLQAGDFLFFSETGYKARQ